jgi:biotin operon repressor
MKKSILAFILLFQISCNNTEYKLEEKTQSDNEKIYLIKTDPSWIKITEISKKFTDAIINSNYKTEDINWADLNQISKVTGISENDLENMMQEIKDAGNLILAKYNHSNKLANCATCSRNYSEKEAIEKFKLIISKWRTNSRLKDKYYSNLRVSEGEPNCPIVFYLCVATCAVTIEAFPLYLACCTICLCEFCDTPPESLCGDNASVV